MIEYDVRDALAGSSEFAKKHTSAATLQVVVAADGDASKRIVIDGIFAGGDAAGSIQFYDSADAAIDGYFFTWPAGGKIEISNAFLKKNAANTGLKYSTLLGGNHAVIVKYHPELRS